MEVHLFNDTVQGTTALAARRLHHALLRAGITSHFWHGQPDAEVERDPSYRVLPKGTSPSGHLGLRNALQRVQREIRTWQTKRALQRRPPESVPFSPAAKSRPTHCPLECRDAVLHLHQVGQCLDIASFFASLSTDVPVLWTVHDMQPFTGGCHHAQGCQAYIAECRDCQQLARPGRADLANHSFHLKYSALRGKNLHVVASTRALELQVRRSAVLCCARSIRTIPIGVDLDVFAPRDASAVREALRVPDAAVVFGIDGDEWGENGVLHSQWKEILARLEAPQRYLGFIFGRGTMATLGGESIPVRRLGEIKDQNFLASLYSALDFLVLPTVREGLPQIGMEAMACGVPLLVGSRGEVSEHVRPRETGLLAEPDCAESLARQIKWLSDHRFDRLQMGFRARALAVKEFNAERFVSRYIEVYQELTNTLPARRIVRLSA